MLNTANAHVFLRCFTTLGRLPDYAEYGHFADLTKVEEKPHFSTNNQTYIDVTQMLNQKYMTGIQKVVDSFVKANHEMEYIFFREGNFYKVSFPKSALKRKDGLTWINRLVKVTRTGILHVGYRVWSKFLLRFFQNKKKYPIIVKILKNFRNMLIPRINGSQIVNPLHFIGATIFIPDLPADRKHLETLLVLSENSITKLKILVHDLIPIINPELMPTGSTQEFNLYSRILPHATTLICLSHKVEKDLMNWIKFVNPKVKSPLIKVFSPLIEGSSDVKSKLLENRIIAEIEESYDNYVVAVGTILQRKNYGVVIRALKILEESNISCTFIIIANLKWDDRTVKLAKKSLHKNKVVIIPSVKNEVRDEIIRRSNGVVYPSLAEGFGIPIYEALALKKKILINDISPMNEWKDFFSNIVVVKENSGTEWAKELSNLLVKNEELITKESFSDISWEAWANRVLRNL
jgi:glycosyltransferase involved in cell wall biosynthesis